ncbi:hypothetical protein EN836_09640 [Mesorhizobium sp. M1C.F.Ca.ET.193.01.1.1]|uniref:hypothetical protein n=1 Tax=unclassified Mesorhizobium TaxID=325217 RepID=UPI000FD324B9|nr:MULTISPECIES: hypothetical protein [unclassified Mesorhizobium]TGT01986.1 hypothetical protein EN820_28490 [bacterium M00.F.Ca.ET.177.01.1.1]RWA72003.1 MAG: hypothetical protein EOQ28_16900 [Mesorhizobium sp.]RWC05464.1 MAG: hypothetical protein EOQ57_03690 [Mesorhizobium sp.]RWG84357.1 MAG: hypothetical protein EOQ69_11935 [Mesorhizobium sp.]RWG89417.1 MAG: hypothetical protein EOQ70_07830 [Mesorhizobium sp.]
MKPRVLLVLWLGLLSATGARADGTTGSQAFSTSRIAQTAGQYGQYIGSNVRGMDPLGSLGGNVGYKNTGSGNIGAFNSGTGNVGAFNGNENTSATSGNHNIGAFNGNGNTGEYDGNTNVGAFNGNFNGGSFNGSGNVGAFNGNFNGRGNR